MAFASIVDNARTMLQAAQKALQATEIALGEPQDPQEHQRLTRAKIGILEAIQRNQEIIGFFDQREQPKDNPPPTEGKAPVTDRLITELLQADKWEAAQAVIDQAAKGKAKYGTVLKTFNGRRSLLDKRQELADALQYDHQHELELKEILRLIDKGDTFNARKLLVAVIYG